MKWRYFKDRDGYIHRKGYDVLEEYDKDTNEWFKVIKFGKEDYMKRYDLKPISKEEAFLELL